MGLQRSSPPKLEVFQTVEKGWGVRAAVDLPKGAFVCCYLGEALSWNHFPQPELCFVKQLSQPQRQIDKRLRTQSPGHNHIQVYIPAEAHRS